jgi:hypothetical protein
VWRRLIAGAAGPAHLTLPSSPLCPAPKRPTEITKGARRCKQCTSAQPVAVKSVDGDKDGAFAADGGNKGEKMV